MTSTTVNQRIQLLIEYYQLTQNSFSIKTKMANNSILGKIINDPARRPSYETLCKILETFPEINCRWLMLGEGEMILHGLDSFPDPADRIVYMMKRLNVSTPQLAEKTRISEEEITSYIRKDKTPELKVLTYIANAYPEINPTWMLFNEGDMLRNGSF